MNNLNELDTDFLCTSSNFLTGMANVFNIGGNFYAYNSSETEIDADVMALSNDFKLVGNDLKKAIDKHSNY